MSAVVDVWGDAIPQHRAGVGTYAGVAAGRTCDWCAASPATHVVLDPMTCGYALCCPTHAREHYGIVFVDRTTARHAHPFGDELEVSA